MPAHGKQRVGAGQARMFRVVNEAKRRINEFAVPPMQRWHSGCLLIVIARHDMNVQKDRQPFGPALEVVLVSASGGQRRMQKIAENDQPAGVDIRHQPAQPLTIGFVGARGDRHPVAAKVTALTEMSIGDDDGAATRPDQRPLRMEHQALTVDGHRHRLFPHRAIRSSLFASRSTRFCQDSVDSVCVCRRSAHNGKDNGV